MSKIYDVEKMYGQDFGIVTTNAPSNIIKQAKKLLPNTFLISSPQNENGEDSDNNLPSIFVTDYNAQPLRLTYPFYMKNGLNYSDEYGYAFINIDNSTIKTENLDGSGKLKVNTENLSNATFNKKGVVKLSEQLTDINRNLKTDYNLQDSISGKYNNSTFITVNNDGILYLNNDLLDLINNLVDLKIKQKIDSIKIMLNSNLKMWIEITAINGNTYVNNIHNVGSLTDAYTIDNNTPTSLTFNLHYLSFSDASESVQIIDTSNKIYSIVFEGENPDEKHLTMVKSLENNDELYEHVINNISIIFLPNYFIENNENYKQEIPLVFEIDNDKSETLLIQQDRLSNYGIVIDVNGDKELRVNEILNIAVESGIDETIQLNGFANEIKLDGENIIKYQIDTFIVNTYDESNNYELSTIDDYKNTGEISITNLSDKNKSKLYHFIEGIIDQNDSDEDENSSDQYYIDTSKTIRNNGQDILISDFVEQLINDSVIKYYIKFGTNLKILTTNNKEIGSYNKVIEVQLNLDKKTIYGYIFITGTNINGKDESYPVHMYYPNRVKTNNSEQRVYLNNKTQYEPTTIDTEKLYGIYGDFKINDGFNIPYTFFKIYNTKNVSGSNNGITAIKDPQTDVTCLMEDSSDATFNIYYDENNMGNNHINISSNNHYTNLLKLFYDGFTFNINYNQSNESSIIKKQLVKLNINLLEILLTNTEFGRISDNSWIRDFKINTTNIPNTSNYNSSDYYNMDNYVLTGYNNNQVHNIKVSLPECVKSILLLNQSNKFYIHLYFYVNSNNNSDVQKVSIVFNKQPSEKIAGSLVTNNNSSNLIDPSDIIDTIDDQLIDNSYIIKSKSDFLPKLLMISYSINEQNEKICYVQNTYTCNGGSISQINGEKQIKQLKTTIYNSSQILYDIINVINNDQETINNTLQTISKEKIIKSILKNTSNILSSNISVESLDLSGVSLLFNDGSVSSDIQSFDLLIDNNKKYYEAEFGQSYLAKFKYKYLSNPNDKLDGYNYYSKTPIDGSQKITQSGYQIRFNNILFKFNPKGLDSTLELYYFDDNTDDNTSSRYTYVRLSDNNVIIYHFGSNNDNSLENFRTNILSKIFTFEINGSPATNNMFSSIDLDNFNGSTIDNINTYKLLLNYTLYNTSFTNVLLGYNIIYNHLYWTGFNGNGQTIVTLNNNDINLTEGKVVDQTNEWAVKFEQSPGNIVVFNDIKQDIFKWFNNDSTSTLDTNKSTITVNYNVYTVINNKNIPIPGTIAQFTLSKNEQYYALENDDVYFTNSNDQRSYNIIVEFTEPDYNISVFNIIFNPNHVNDVELSFNNISNSDNWPITVFGNDTTINVGGNNMTKRSYKLNNDVAAQNYSIQCIARGKNNGGIHYADAIYSGVIEIIQNQKRTNDDFYFVGPLTKITSLPISTQQSEQLLQTLHIPSDLGQNSNPTWDSIQYSCELISWDNTLVGNNKDVVESAISTTSNDMSFVTGHKKISINKDNVQGMGELIYKITATLSSYGDYLETSTSTSIEVNISSDSGNSGGSEE